MSKPSISARVSTALMVAALGLFWNGDIPTRAGSTLISSAEARIGRPLTPMSYAGVARRTTRRAVAAGAVAVGAAAVVAAPVVVAPRAVVVTPVCGQVVNSYGQIVTVCR